VGNLIIGYDEDSGENEKTGSHNLVIGPNHTYSSWGGVVAGTGNAITNAGASVTGGTRNTSAGAFSSVTGGSDNYAGGRCTDNVPPEEPDELVVCVTDSDCEGYANVSPPCSGGGMASVSAGRQNMALGSHSSVSGGGHESSPTSGNRAMGVLSAVSGGADGTASGNYSSVSGGLSNTAGGFRCAVTGGHSNTAMGSYSVVTGGEFNRVDFEADYSVLLGGKSAATVDQHSVVGGSVGGCCAGDRGGLSIGAACVTPTECASGYCIDGYCCSGSCDGTCESCAVPSSLGTCSPIAANTDPDGECVGVHPDCGATCNGSGQCDFPAIGTTCGLCRACDGVGRCSEKPRFGRCKTSNDPASCTSFVDLCQ
jgi:hypothetical protein